MRKRKLTRSSAAAKLDSIHRRMAEVTEEEVFAALESPEPAPQETTRGASTCLTITYLASEASSRGATARILRNIIAGRLRLIVSSDIVKEYVELIKKPSVHRLLGRHGVSLDECLEIIDFVCQAAEFLTPKGEAPSCRDEKDRMYLHCALVGAANYLVTRDADLLAEVKIGNTAIVSPSAFLATVKESGVLLQP